MAKNKPTKLDELVDRAADLLVELSELDRDRKLTYAAFLKEACTIAGIDEKRLAVVKKIVYERPGTEYLQSFLRRYSKMLSGIQYPRPVEDPSRLIKPYGSEDLLPQCSQHQILLGELQALAVVVTRERFGDAVFGNVENRAEHEKKTLEARKRLAAIHEEMRQVVCGADLIYDDSYPAVLPSQKEAGLCKVSFRRCAGVSPSFGDWPEQIIADAIDNPPKPKREKLSKKAA